MRSRVKVASVAGWLRRLKERYVDPEDVDDGEELTLDVVEHVSEHLETLEAVLRGEGDEKEGTA